MQFSISSQIFEIILTTLLVLPSFINPLLPVLLILSYFYFNYVINNTSEVKIINQFVSKKEKYKWILIINFLIITLFFINSEIISPKLYSEYKINELKVRNNLKIGLPTKNQFHIGGDLSIFFQIKNKNIFEDVESILLKEGQFIKSEFANIEYDKSGVNIIFYNGFRIKLNQFEKSKTIFEKFTYHIEKEINDKLSFDKEHYNTSQLLNHEEIDFKNSGHKRIYYYFLLLVILVFSERVIFDHNNNYSKLKKIKLFTFLMMLYLINTYLIYKLDKSQINIIFYYIINILGLFSFSLYLNKYSDY